MKKTSAIVLCLVLACAAFSAPAETAPAEETLFVTMGDVVTDQSYIYSSSDYYIILREMDGAWWRIDAQVDDRYSEMYTAVAYAEDPGAAYNEMTDYVGTLPVASAEKLDEQPLSYLKLNSYAGKKVKDLLADGFGFDYVQGLTADETKATGKAQVLRPADKNGTVYRVPLYLTYLGPEYTEGIQFNMNMGIYAYQFCFSGTEETLKEAVENGTWEEMKIDGPGIFIGFRMEMEQTLMGAASPRKFPTKEEAAAIRTVKDAHQYDFIGIYSPGYEEYTMLINGADSFWIAKAELDDRYRELFRASYNAEDESSDELWKYESALPVTVTAVDSEHPPLADMPSYTGKTIRELQEEGFRICWLFATTTDPAKEDFNRAFTLPGIDGNSISVNGSFSYNEFNEYCLLDMEQGMYRYTFSLDGNAESLEAAVKDGTFPDMTVHEMTYSGMSEAAANMLLFSDP